VEQYKLYQLLNFFVQRYSYAILRDELVHNDEIWLVNLKNDTYQLIRLTLNSIEQAIFDESRVSEIKKMLLKRNLNKEIKFLDIHVTKETVGEDECFDSVCLNSNYYSGLDISYAYPGIKNVVHEVSDPNMEIINVVNDINFSARTKLQQKRNMRRFKFSFTNIFIILCFINFIINYLLGLKFDDSVAAVMVGGYYKTFITGLYQYWRLITVAFTHGGIWHLLMNMMAMYTWGGILEDKLGKKKFIALFFGSVIMGSLVSGIINSNGISVGASGGLYGLMAFFLVLAIQNQSIDESMIRIIVLNLIINFIPGVDYLAHIGGAIFGIVFALAYQSKNQKLWYSVAILFIVVGLIFFHINDLLTYPAFDKSIVNAYEELGLKNYAEFLWKRLMKLY